MSDERILELLEQNNKKLLTMIKGELFPEFRLMVKADTEQLIEDNSRIVVDLLRQDIKASKVELRQEMREMKEEIIHSFYDVVDNGILPQLDKLDRRVARLERG